MLPDRHLVWRGPAASKLGVGGRLALAPDGRLVIGVGDLQRHGRIDDPEAPNGKLLALDVDAPADQRPRVLSGGWTNPFAFAFTPSGDLWVADNAIGGAKERLARGDKGSAADVTDLPPVTAPSGLAALSDRKLVLCGYVSRELTRYAIGAGGARGERATRWRATARSASSRSATAGSPTRPRTPSRSSTRPEDASRPIAVSVPLSEPMTSRPSRVRVG